MVQQVPNTKTEEMTRNQQVQCRQLCLLQNTWLFQKAKIVEKGLCVESAESTVRALYSSVFNMGNSINPGYQIWNWAVDRRWLVKGYTPELSEPLHCPKQLWKLTLKYTYISLFPPLSLQCLQLLFQAGTDTCGYGLLWYKNPTLFTLLH